MWTSHAGSRTSGILVTCRERQRGHAPSFAHVASRWQQPAVALTQSLVGVRPGLPDATEVHVERRGVEVVEYLGGGSGPPGVVDVEIQDEHNANQVASQKSARREPGRSNRPAQVHCAGGTMVMRVAASGCRQRESTVKGNVHHSAVGLLEVLAPPEASWGF